MEVLARAKVAIIFQYINVLNNVLYPLNLYTLCVNYISVKKEFFYFYFLEIYA